MRQIRRAFVSVALAIMAMLMLISSNAFASAVEQLKLFSASTQSAKGEFSQQGVVGRGGKPSPVSSGDFAFSKPGKFRWQIRQPYEQLIIADGQKLYMYDKDLSQVTVRPLTDAVSATPAAVLFGQGDVEKLFTLQELPNREGLEWLEATPKSKDSTFLKFSIGFKNGVPQVMELHDALGQVTLLTFAKWVRNNLGPSDLFKFSAPPGTDVIEGGGGLSSGKPQPRTSGTTPQGKAE